MKDNLTDIICILDRSGSMGSIRSDAIGGFNTFLADRSDSPAKPFTSFCSTMSICSCTTATPIAQAKPLDNRTYQPQGTTALLDAVGRTIDDVGKRLHNTPEEERPSKVIVPSSPTAWRTPARTTSQQPASPGPIKHQQEKYSWEFIFLANQDAIAPPPPPPSAREISICGQGRHRVHVDAGRRVQR